MFLDVQFDIDVMSRFIKVREDNKTVIVCVIRTNETTQVYNVTLKAKENTNGLIADGTILMLHKS